MARRRGGLMALRAALGAVGGGLQGYTQMQEREREMAAKLLEQQKRDAATARAERLSYLQAGFVPEAQYQAQPGIPGGMPDMPGAAPRAPFMSEVLSTGERMVMAENPQAMAHRKSILERQGRIAEAAAKDRAEAETKAETEQEQMDRFMTVIANARRGGPRSEAANSLLAISPSAYRAVFPEAPSVSPQRAVTAGEGGYSVLEGGRTRYVPYPAGFTPRQPSNLLGPFLSGGSPFGADQSQRLPGETPEQYARRMGGGQ